MKPIQRCLLRRAAFIYLGTLFSESSECRVSVYYISSKSQCTKRKLFLSVNRVTVNQDMDGLNSKFILLIISYA